MNDFRNTSGKPSNTDWYAMASYGFPVEEMLSTSPGVNLNLSEDIPGFSLPSAPSSPELDALLQFKDKGLWHKFTQGFKDSGIIGGTNADGTKFDGWGSPAIGLLQALNAFSMGNRQLKMHKTMLDDARNQFAMNYGAQRQTMNTRMEDRQRARVAANPAAESVESYMARNRIK